MDAFEVRELRYFVTVAEELSFSRAAERLGMAQPPLSRAIRQMERRLGAELFRRDTRQVALTELGESLVDQARDAIEIMSALGERARRAARTTPTLVATAKPGIATEMLRRIVAAYAEVPDRPLVEILVSGYREQSAMVRDGRADVAVLGSPYDRWRLDLEVLTTQPRVAALPAGHRLALAERLHCSDLHGEPMPRWERSTRAERAYSIGRAGPSISADEAEGVPGPVVSDPTQLLEVVSLGQAVALIPQWLADRNPRDDLVYRPVSDASPYTTAIAWPEGTRSRMIADFVRTATEIYKPASARSIETA
ncbi:LysR family transcriptional regulator [Spirillospora sp. CA-294931]|uniref:LysR family transcriptional regulator n=1 Tax=Spirillospora sp. CA-294931 TaxID=3240042 RepID=UPI003D8A33C9